MILVTGAAGLIGSCVVRELNRLSYNNILLVDNLGQSEKWNNLKSLKFLEYIEKDDFYNLLTSKEKNPNDSLLKEIKTIIHLGANSSTTEKNASFLIQNNYRYSIELAKFAINKNIRMVYASSAATYGDGSIGFNDDLKTIKHLRPLNMYGYSKHLFDMWLLRRNWKPSFVGLKYFNIFGPNEYHKGEMMSLVIKAYNQIKENGSLNLFKSYNPKYEDGKQMRDFLYVEDAAKVTVFFAIENKKTNGIFNVGSGKASTWLELADAIFESLKIEKKINFIEMPNFLKEKYQYFTCANLELLQNSGYRENNLTLKKAVEDYVCNYLIKGNTYA